MHGPSSNIREAPAQAAPLQKKSLGLWRCLVVARTIDALISKSSFIEGRRMDGSRSSTMSQSIKKDVIFDSFHRSHGIEPGMQPGRNFCGSGIDIGGFQRIWWRL